MTRSSDCLRECLQLSNCVWLFTKWSFFHRTLLPLTELHIITISPWVWSFSLTQLIWFYKSIYHQIFDNLGLFYRFPNLILMEWSHDLLTDYIIPFLTVFWNHCLKIISYGNWYSSKHKLSNTITASNLGSRRNFC